MSAIRSRLGEMLLSAKQITSAQLESALEVQRKHGGLLGAILVTHGSLDRETLDVALAAQARSGRKAAYLPWVRLGAIRSESPKHAAMSAAEIRNTPLPSH